MTATLETTSPAVFDQEPISDTIVIDLDPSIDLGLPELPPGYGFVGGAARSIALKQLYGEDAPIRDIDIVGFVENKPDLSLQQKLSEKHMPDDYAHGYGVSIESFDEYFRTRDFTINEVAVVGGKIHASQAAIDDLRDKVIRPTDHELGSWGSLGPKLTVKAYLLETVFKDQFGQAVVDDEHTFHGHIEDFYIALGLNKAFEYGPHIASQFVNRLEQLGAVEQKSVTDPYALAVSLKALTGFIFRGEHAHTLNNYSEIPSSDLVRPVSLDGYDEYADLANNFRGPGHQNVGKNEY